VKEDLILNSYIKRKIEVYEIKYAQIARRSCLKISRNKVG
jgi:hypothetical protein